MSSLRVKKTGREKDANQILESAVANFIACKLGMSLKKLSERVESMTDADIQNLLK